MALGGQGPAHAIAEEAQLHQPTGEATFRGHARLWQQANSVSGPLIVLDRQKQTLVASTTDPADPVKAVLLSAGAAAGKAAGNHRGRMEAVLTLIDECPLRDKVKNKNVSIVSLSDRKSINIFKAAYRTNKISKKFKPDILQAWMYHSELIGLVIKILNPSIKLFWNIRCSTEEWKNLRLRNKLILKILICCAGLVSSIFVNSKSELRSDITLGYPKKKLYYIPNGFEDVDISSKPDKRKKLVDKFGLGSDAIIIGMVARNDPAKDHDNILDALIKLKNLVSNVHLIIVGTGFDQKFIYKVNNLNLQNNVHFYGASINVFDAILGFDIGVLSSMSESFPNVIAEYMLAALPVVCTDISDVREIIGEEGFVIPAQNSQILNDTLYSVILISEKEKNKLGIAARQRILENFMIGKVSKAYQSKYIEALNKS